mgnify:CR=1 FL=1
MMVDSPEHADAAALGRWILSWVQASGAIHGFANHSVWGGHPATVGDDWCGHSTFASPLLPALAEAAARQPAPAALERLETAIAFQCESRQADGQFAHVGFQVGERVQRGLVHTVVPAAALCEAVAVAGARLSAPLIERVERTVREVLEASESIYGEGASGKTVANQEAIRLAARLQHMAVFDHAAWDNRVRADLAFLAEHFHVPGVPDGESAGCLRSMPNPDALEPAEYYGLIIKPLVLAGRRYGAPEYLDQAMRLARHVVRSAWADPQGRRRVHRTWRRLGGAWTRVCEPMLLAGIGLTLEAIADLLTDRPDAECEAFLTGMERTYARAQSPAGMLLAATGWRGEQDIIPATAWQSHDLLYLLRRHGVPDNFEAAIEAPDPRAAAVLGHHMLWLETDRHWALDGPETLQRLRLRGRKDHPHFELMLSAWVAGGPPDPAMVMENPPRFFATDDRIVHVGGREDLALLNASGLAYEGPGECGGL